jgi:LPS export ABC transporter permease LptG/LPS export ABC transporter permease LptF
MFRILDRYVYREMLPVFALATGLFTFLHVMDRLNDFSNMAANGAPLHLVLRVWGLLLVSFMSHTLPMGLLLAVVITAGRLTSDLEVVGFGALGVSPLRLFRPFLVASIVVAMMVGALTMWINPWGSAAFFRYLRDLRQHAAFPLIQERTFTRVGDLVIYADRKDLSTSELSGLVIGDERDPRTFGIITAPSGRLIDDAERRRTILRLTDGAVHESRPTSPNWYRVTGFKFYDMPLDVTAPIAEAQKELGAERNETTWDLMENTRALDFTRKAEHAEMFVVEFHKRLALPLAPIVFAMVVFPLGIRLQRGGRAVAAVSGIMVYLVHHVVQEGLGRVAVLRPWGGRHWVPIALFALLGVVLLYFTAHSAPPAWRRGVSRLLQLLPARLSPFRRLPTGPRRDRTRRLRRQSSIIDRYVARQFLIYVGYGLGLATAIFVVVDLVETLSRYRPPLQAILEHFGYRLPAALHQALPIIVLVATVFLFMELQRYNELTALKALGLSLHRVSLPVLVLAGAASVAAFVFQETAAPVLSAKADELDRVEIRKVAARGSAPQYQWYRRSDTEFVRLGRLDRALRQVQGVTLVQTDANFRLVKRLDAATAVWAPNGLEFGQSVLREFGPDKTMRTTWQDEKPRRLADSLEALGAMPAPSAMTFMELRAYVRHLRERGQAVGTQVLRLHSKISFPLMSLVLAFLAISFTARWQRGGRLVGAALAVVIVIAYSVVNSVALSLGRVDLLPSVVAAWTATIVFGGIGVALFMRAPT